MTLDQPVRPMKPELTEAAKAKREEAKKRLTTKNINAYTEEQHRAFSERADAPPTN